MKLVVSWNKIRSFIDTDSILYIERNDRVSYVVTEDGTYKSSMTISILDETTPDYLLRCHQSYLVNMNRLKTVSFDSITLDTGHEIPVSRARTQSVHNYINDTITSPDVNLRG